MTTPALPTTLLKPGLLVAKRYSVTALIAAGGNGAVYAALDTTTGETVALKQLTALNELAEQAFLREVQLLRELRHPRLPAYYGHVADESGLFLVMEHIPGEDLGTLLTRRREPFEPGVVLVWADELLELLGALHGRRAPIIHRDIKPQNLKLTPEGRLMLVDFGLARAVTTGLTTAPTVFGYTLAYASIEQIQGGTGGPRDDIYAVGATLYHLLTGHPPVDALTRAAAVINGQPDPLTPLQVLQPLLPIAAAHAINGALALQLDKRPASAMALRSALRGEVAAADRAYTGATLLLDRQRSAPFRLA